MILLAKLVLIAIQTPHGRIGLVVAFTSTKGVLTSILAVLAETLRRIHDALLLDPGSNTNGFFVAFSANLGSERNGCQ